MADGVPPSSPRPGAGVGLARSLHRLSTLTHTDEGAEIAARLRGSQPIPPQDQRPGRAVRGGRAAIALAAAIPSLILVTILVFVVAGPEDAETSSYTAPELRTWAAIAAAVMAVVSIWAWRRYWVVADTPTVDVAGAHPGRCELVGTARPLGEAVTSWFTGAPVIWYHATVTGPAADDGKSKPIWQRGDGSRRFRLVGDDGATIEVDATGALIDGDRLVVRHHLDRKRQITEHALVSGDRVYVLGPVHLRDDGQVEVAKGPRRGLRRQPLWITQRGESGVRRRLRRIALATTALTTGLAALVTAVEEVPSDDPEHETELVMRQDGALLAPAMTVAGLIAVGYLIGYLWRLWNRLVELRNQAAEAWSLIDVAAARRHATIGNLAAVTGAAAAHERAALSAPTDDPSTLPRSAAVERVDAELTEDNGARTAILARVEAMPSVRSEVAFDAMFHELTMSENRLAAARRFYNDAVTELADRTTTFPGLLLKPLVAARLPPLLRFDLAAR